MNRVCRSCDSISDPSTCYASPSWDSMLDKIVINPNGSLDALKHPGQWSYTPQVKLMRQHDFRLKISYSGNSCFHCARRIGFTTASLSCRSCPLRCHPECYSDLTVNCVPQPVITSKAGYLSDFAPLLAPRVPALIVHCATEIEARGLNQEGLYRVSSTKEKCKRLSRKFQSVKALPHLGNRDVHTLCCCIKDFLRSLIVPLIPNENADSFMAALSEPGPVSMQQQVYFAVRALPSVHRDTLVFLILHWKRVALSPAVKMSEDNIAAVVVPTIFNDTQIDMSNVGNWQNVVRMLLELPVWFWEQCFEQPPEPTKLSYSETKLAERHSLPTKYAWQSLKSYFWSMVSESLKVRNEGREYCKSST